MFQSGLVQKVSLSRRMISIVKVGISKPNLDNLRRIAEPTDTTPSWFLTIVITATCHLGRWRWLELQNQQSGGSDE